MWNLLHVTLLGPRFFLGGKKILLPFSKQPPFIVCFLLGDSPASDLYMPTFRNSLSVPSSKAGVTSHLPLKMEQIESSETSEYINQTLGNRPKENKQHSEHGESLKSRKEKMMEFEKGSN